MSDQAEWLRLFIEAYRNEISSISSDALEVIASRLERYGKAMEALEMAEVTLRLDGERMATAGMSTRQNAEAHRIVSAVLQSNKKAPASLGGERAGAA